MDRRKMPANDIVIPESDRQFLERVGATSQLKDVLTKIIENRPQDPIDFLADYFESYGDKVSRVTRVFHQICMTHYSKPAFDTNLRNAYDTLSQNKIGKNLKGVNGVIYTDLLNHLVKDFPPAVSEKLMKKIHVRDHEVVVFETFKAGTFTCLVLKDFLKQSELLYQCLDVGNNEKVDKNVADLVIKQLVDAVNKTSNGPTGLLEASYKLGPEKMSEGLRHCPPQTTQIKRTTSLEDFQAGIADAFLSKVKTGR